MYRSRKFLIVMYVRNVYFRGLHGNETRFVNVDDNKVNGDDKLAEYLEDVPGYSVNDFDTTLDTVIKGRLNVDDVIKRHRRVRRNVTKKDTIEHVTKIMESIEEELDDLKVTFAD